MKTNFLILLKNAFNRVTKPFKDWQKRRKLKQQYRTFNIPWTKKEEKRRIGPIGSNNHNQSEPKYRRTMAIRSNRINRDRVKHWKY